MYSSSRHTRLLAVALLGAGAALAQASGQQLASLGDFKLESGEIIRDCKIGYRTFGTLNEQRSNAILLPTWFSGRSADLAGAASGMIDASRYFVIAVDALGDGVSSSPSNSPAQPRLSFPRFTIRDMVNSEHRLLTEVLKISHLYAVMGISMGGMQTFEWIVAYPDFMDKAIPIVGSPRLTSYDVMLWETEKHIIEEDRDWNKGNYKSMPPLQALSDLHKLNLTTPRYRVEHTNPGEVAAYLAEIEKRSPTAFDANDWLRQLEAMIAHDVSRGYGGSMEQAVRAVKAKLLVVVATQDHMVNPAPAMDFAKRAGAMVVELTGDCGHLATGCEAAKMERAVKEFVDK